MASLHYHSTNTSPQPPVIPLGCLTTIKDASVEAHIFMAGPVAVGHRRTGPVRQTVALAPKPLDDSEMELFK